MRCANSNDLERILRLLDVAFAPSQVESCLVRALVENARPIHHWVLESEGTPTGYLCYSQAYRAGLSVGLHLAPVAVHPQYQGNGLGSKIIRDTLLQQPIAGRSVFVLGEPSYYSRFGFRRISQPTCPFEPTNDHFMALHYDSRDIFSIAYEPEFMSCEPNAPTNSESTDSSWNS